MCAKKLIYSLLSLVFIMVSITFTPNNQVVYATSNEDVIYAFMKNELGFNTAVASAALANIYSESSFNPNSYCIDTDGYPSYGICQWHLGRYDNLKSYCNNNGYDYKSLSGQLQFLKYEFNTSYKKQYNNLKSYPNTAQGAYDASYYWAAKFEVCSSKYWNRRGELARDTYYPRHSGDDLNPETIGHVMSESEAAGRTLLDGDYWICSGYNMNYFLDIPGVEISPSGTNVWMWSYENEMPTSYDVWTVTYLNNGFYRIKQKGSSVSLDVNGGTVDRGANVQLWSDNDSNAQQWSIARTDYGYTLQSRCSAFFMDIYDAGTENGTNVSTYTKNGERWQNWCFIPYNADERPIADGIYNIQTACDSNFYVDAEGAHGKFTNETNIILYNETTDSFKVSYVGDGWYSICEASSGLSLDVYNAEPAHYLDVSMNIQLHANNQKRNQLWKIRNTGDGHYWIISKLNGYCFDLDHGKAENGTNISQYPYNGGTNQKWNFVPVTLSEITVTPPSKITYTVGETLNTSGMKVIAKYSDTSTIDVTNNVKVSGDLSTAGTQTVTVSYAEGNITKTATFKITVNAATTTTQTTTATTTSSTTTTTTIEALKVEEMALTMENGEQYTIKANQDNLIYKTNDNSVAIVSKNGLITAVGEGKAVISVINSEYDVVQINITVIPINKITGDCNNDGIFNISDVVLLQKWLLAVPNTHIEDWKAADLYEDNILDVFDLCMMKRKLINN